VLPFTYGTDSLNSCLKKLRERFFVEERPFRAASERGDERGFSPRFLLMRRPFHIKNPSAATPRS
jgi:hypothetical protein